jgi:3-hydroxyisobutyrate dehydrogenase
MSAVGFIGLGNMGFPMAERLADAGHKILVHDAQPSAVERFLELHPTAAAGQIAGWDSAAIIITMLPTSAIVEAVLLDSGVAETALPNTLFVDMSSAEPLASKRLGETLTSRGLRYIDAPVSGGVRGAVNGQLAIMTGGAPADVENAQPLFDLMGKSTIHVGAAGAGHAAKALNNLVSAASVAATVEALHVGARFGIEPATLTAVLNASSGRTNTSENKVNQFMLSGTFASGFPIGLMTKDVNIAIDLADQLEVAAELGHHVADLWRSAVSAGHAGEDHTRMYEVLDRPEPAHAHAHAQRGAQDA